MPNSIEDYVHRIGRTGRAGQTGEAYAFFTPKNARMANDLAKYLVEACQVGRLAPSTAFPTHVFNRMSQ
jgi:superfamily II DNA/RNA helicase